MKRTGKVYGFRVNFQTDKALITELDGLIAKMKKTNPKATIKDVIEELLKDRRASDEQMTAAHVLTEFNRVTAEMRAFMERLG